MPREKKQRVATEAAAEMQTNPFAALDLGPLREAPPTAALASKPQKETKERLLLRRSTAHRGGKTVLLVDGFGPAWNAARLTALLHELKAKLGCGGKLEGRTMEIQGEQADRLQPLLETRGFTIKRGW